MVKNPRFVTKQLKDENRYRQHWLYNMKILTLYFPAVHQPIIFSPVATAAKQPDRRRKCFAYMYTCPGRDAGHNGLVGSQPNLTVVRLYSAVKFHRRRYRIKHRWPVAHRCAAMIVISHLFALRGRSTCAAPFVFTIHACCRSTTDYYHMLTYVFNHFDDRSCFVIYPIIICPVRLPSFPCSFFLRF